MRAIGQCKRASRSVLPNSLGGQTGRDTVAPEVVWPAPRPPLARSRGRRLRRGKGLDEPTHSSFLSSFLTWQAIAIIIKVERCL